MADRTYYLPVVEAGVAAKNQHRLPEKMIRAVRDFDQDDEGHWRARLECGHYQHVRHDPPLRTREWVLTEEGRNSRIGDELDCGKCDEAKARDFDD